MCAGLVTKSCLTLEIPWTLGHQAPLSMEFSRQESLRRNGVALIVNKRVLSAVLGCNLKNDRMISVCFHAKPFNMTVIQIYTPTINAEEAKVEQFYEELQDLLELTHTKKVSISS